MMAPLWSIANVRIPSIADAVTSTLKPALAVALIASPASSLSKPSTPQSAARADADWGAPADQLGIAADVHETAENQAAGSILVGSTPAAGSIVSAPVDQLDLRFDPPARLGEVIVTGPDGAMPMMVTAVGEVRYYSLPLPSLDAGNYTVAWQANIAGKDHRGSFRFSVR